jgi:glycerophosphoryl diester phosphodiesterase
MRLAGLLFAGLGSPAMTAAPAPPQPVTIVAHRGLAEGVPENTLAAFRQSIANGIQVIELDLRVTRDGQLVILHDLTLDRTTDCSGAVAAMRLARVKTCDAGHGERVPTFAEVIALVQGKPVRVLADVKAGTPIGPVLKAVRQLQAERQVILGLRSPGEVARARAALPGVTILAFMPRMGDAPAFTQAGADILRLWSDWVEADSLLVDRTARLGPQVWIMVGRRLPSKPAEWKALHGRMIATGAQGLITNRPDLISAP